MPRIPGSVWPGKTIQTLLLRWSVPSGCPSHHLGKTNPTRPPAPSPKDPDRPIRENEPDISADRTPPAKRTQRRPRSTAAKTNPTMAWTAPGKNEPIVARDRPSPGTGKDRNVNIRRPPSRRIARNQSVLRASPSGMIFTPGGRPLVAFFRLDPRIGRGTWSLRPPPPITENPASLSASSGHL